jgi:Zn-dependent protease
MSAEAGAKKGKKTALFSGITALTAVYLKFQGAILAAFKAGGLLKFAWIFKSGWTMLLSLGLYTMAFGWRFAVGLVLLLLIHEGGHWIWMKAYGLDPKAPVFIPFVGAYVAMNKLPADAATHAWVAYAGPFVGGLGALALYLIGLVSNTTWLMAAGSAGFLLNLFQLVPAKPLDGGFIVGAISKWFLLIGFVFLAILTIYLQSFILILITFFSGRSLWGQFFGGRNAPKDIYSGGAKTVKELEEMITKPETQASQTAGNSPQSSGQQRGAGGWQKFAIGTAYIGLTLALGFLYTYSAITTAAKSGLSAKLGSAEPSDVSLVTGSSKTSGSSSNSGSFSRIYEIFRGSISESLGKYDDAIDAFSKVIVEKPDNFVLYQLRGGAYFKSGQYQKAVDDFSKSIELSATYVPYFLYLDRGKAYLRLAQYQKAIDDCSQALKLNPKCANAFFYRAQAYEKLNKKELAEKDFDKAKELGCKLSDK